MLEIGEAKKRKAGIDDQIDFVRADAQQLPFETGQFQIVAVAFGLRNVADTDRGLSEMARVCAGGGKVAVLEFSMPQRQPAKAVYGWYFRHILPKIGQWFTRNSHAAYEYLPSSVSEFPSGQALADRMRAGGLRDVTMYPLTTGIATLYVGRK
jgi:demethylmenaquinone methyltransferase/2-methoxy-6-polyprenyl-1,4-benzoquinol methylase